MKGKELQFISQLPSYTFKNTIYRIVVVGFIGFLFMFIAVNNIKIDVPASWTQYFRVIAIFIFLSETNVFIDYISEKYLPIPEKIGIRVLIHLVVNFILTAVIISTLEYWVDHKDLLKIPIVRIMIVLGVLFLITLIIVTIGIRIIEKWINAQKELEKLKQAKLVSDYNALQDQLNPHFLFNTLSVLKSMIIYDQDSAIQFTQNLTDVYRYVLQSRDKTTVKLQDELAFTEAYSNIYKERQGENLKITIDIPNELMDRKIPPLSIQLLVDNAIKHNIAGKTMPLVISVTSNEENIMVKNNYQPKESTYSNHSGLKNLIKRYEILTEQNINIIKNNEFFIVEIPLLI